MSQRPRPDPDGMLFDEYYAASRGDDPRRLPWAHGEPHPMLRPWLDTATRPLAGRDKALVVGSGLGDDAEALAALGWHVTAFDISETAIAWARDRFPATAVDYQVRSLFEQPASWREAFDLVVEIHTVQALPVTRRQATIAAIAQPVAPGETLIVVSMTRDAATPLRGRPWPLTEAELDSFARYGLVESDRSVTYTPAADHPGRVRCHFTRPA